LVDIVATLEKPRKQKHVVLKTVLARGGLKVRRTPVQESKNCLKFFKFC